MKLSVFIAGALLAIPALAVPPLNITGQLQSIPLPPSLVPGSFENNQLAWIAVEDQNFLLTSAVQVDATAPGAYNSSIALSPGTIAAGTDVSDYVLQSDPVASTGTRFIGSVTFPTDIVGVIALSASLTASDSIFGVPGVTYPGTDRLRGYELSPSQDSFTISPDLHTLSFDADTWGNIDELRIVVAAQQGVTAPNLSVQTAPEPAPACLFVIGLGFIMFARWKAFGSLGHPRS